MHFKHMHNALLTSLKSQLWGTVIYKQHYNDISLSGLGKCTQSISQNSSAKRSLNCCFYKQAHFLLTNKKTEQFLMHAAPSTVKDSKKVSINDIK